MNYDNLKYFTWLGFIEFEESKFHNLIPADGKRKQSEARWDQLQGRVDRSLDNEATFMLLMLPYMLLYGLLAFKNGLSQPLIRPNVVRTTILSRT